MDSSKFADFMELAIREAELAFEEGEVPVGAVIIMENRIIGRGHNRTEALRDATAHAEMIALTAAFESVKDWRLDNCYLFSTLEPCIMCAGAAVLARIKTIVYGAPDIRFGGCGTLVNVPVEPRLNHHCEIVSGVRGEEIAEMMRTFFQQVRSRKRVQ